MAIIDKIMSEFENGYGGSVIGKVGYGIVMILLVALSLVMSPFYMVVLAMKRLKGKNHPVTTVQTDYDRMRIK